MWGVYKIGEEGGWYCDDEAYSEATRERADGTEVMTYWPPGHTTFVDLGTATTMCDVFNARGYPEEFMTGVTDDAC